MNKSDIISFFDSCAPTWDAEMIRSDRIIDYILDCAGVKCGSRVLDVACGTGVLFEDYLKRGAKITAIDISPKMTDIARSKFPELDIICGDVESYGFASSFDCAVVYNAFPHFSRPEQLISVLASALAPNGRLTIAHGMSRAAIDAHHSGAASKVSVGLMHEDELSRLMAEHFDVDIKVSDSEKYIVSGVLSLQKCRNSI